jgi:hypothetical protein
MKDRCLSGSAPAFLRRRRGRPDRIVGSPGAGGSGFVPPEPAESRMDGLTVRGPAMRLLVRGTSRSPPSAPASSPQARAARFPRARPGRARSSVPPFCQLLSSALPRRLPAPAPVPAFRACGKPAFACGVPGALRGTWVSPTRFDEDERPVSRERLDMRGTHSHEASSWARGYYAE